MEIIHHIKAFESEGTVATIGFFDGVHKGHQFLIQQVKDAAKKEHLQSLIVTFDQHPRLVLEQDFQPKLLNTLDEKVSLIEKTGVDACYILPFTKEMSKLTSAEFLEQILHQQLHVKKLIIGHDHRFGHNREDNFEQYQQYGKKLGIEIEQTIPFVESETTISSSVIRRLLEQGDVERANEYLNYEYSLSGVVVYGQQNGRKINFPTANLAVDDIHKLIPRLGVYAVKVEVDGEHYFGMLNIGIRPTIDVNNKIPTIEVNIFDFNRDIYSHNLKLIFVKRVRDEVRFKDLAELAGQIKKDQEVIQNIFKTSV